MSNVSIIENQGGELTVTTDAIAVGMEIEHRQVIRSVRENLLDLEKFGRVDFENQPFATAGGRQTREVARLNEHQATFLMTSFRNIGRVKEFKFELVKQFFAMRQALTTSRAAAIGQMNHDLATVEKQAKILRTLRTSMHPDYADQQARILLARALGEEPVLDEATRSLDVSTYLESKGLTAKQASKHGSLFGRRLASEYKREHDKTPPKTDRTVNGASRPVNAYTEADRELFERVFDQYEWPVDLVLEMA